LFTLSILHQTTTEIGQTLIIGGLQMISRFKIIISSFFEVGFDAIF